MILSPSAPAFGATAAFLREWRAAGVGAVRLSGPGRAPREGLDKIEAEAAEDPALDLLLEQWHEEALEDLPGDPLPFDPAAARLGATLLFRAVWCYLQREEDAARIRALLSVRSSVPRTPAEWFAADLCLRCLPDVHRFVSALSPNDPLATAIRRLAADFPLSDAGMPPGENGENPAPSAPSSLGRLQAHPGLWRLFVDRVIESGTRRWLAWPEVCEAVRAAAGAYPAELIPDLLPLPCPASALPSL